MISTTIEENLNIGSTQYILQLTDEKYFALNWTVLQKGRTGQEAPQFNLQGTLHTII